jgi:quinol monooxygenase YgiN
MPIHQTAHYQVNPEAAAKVAAAASAFVSYVAENEPGTLMYAAWQEVDDPSRFVHLFIFADEAAHQAHGASEAVRQFEAVYRPELVGGPVVFTDYRLVAAKMPASPS